MINDKELKIYDADLEDVSQGIFKISLVNDPAVESLWTYYSSTDTIGKEGKRVQCFSIVDEEERIITGCFLRADFPILRKDSEGEYFYIRFSKEVIKLMVLKWMSEHRANNINEGHQKGSDLNYMYLQEVFIKDTEKGISPVGFEDIEEGSAFATYKVLNDDVWEKIKSGELRGYSIEAMTSIVPASRKQEEKEMDEIIEMLNKLKENKK